MKKAIIYNASGNELANQLWNHASIYACAKEMDATLILPVFFEYAAYFKMKAPNLLFKLFFILPFKNSTERKFSFKRRLWRRFYKVYTWFIEIFHKDSILRTHSKNNIPFYLPPTENPDAQEFLKKHLTVYFDGWLARNPKGLKKYREEIRDYFAPQPEIFKKSNEVIQSLRLRTPHVVGVHIRQGDYATWQKGSYLIPQSRVREILNEYIREKKISANTVVFFIASDGKIDPSIFKGLSVHLSSMNAVEDLFALSLTDTVIGSDSTFDNFAAYYGNIPHIVMKKEPIDWSYYNDKKVYFENTYVSWVHY